MLDGILNLDKPRGPTSHDVVQRIRSLIGVRRVGHAGTLDPLATGVLLICIGRATRVAEYLLTSKKAYRACMHLGIATDTYDAEGNITREVSVVVTQQDMETTLDQFRGTLHQYPPIYSAIKQNGTPLHRLARQGADLQRTSLQPRQVDIFHLEMTEWAFPFCTVEVACSSGTYVRALVHDIGETLGCGAHVTTLVREKSGGFCLQDAVQLDEFAQAVAAGHWPDMLHPIDAALRDLPKLQLDQDGARRLCSGQMVVASLHTQPAEPPAEQSRDLTLARAYGPGDTFLAVADYDPVAGAWRPQKVFCAPESMSPCS